MKSLLQICAIFAFITCGIGGIMLMGASGDNNTLWHAMGLYFIGKAFFVGGLLLAKSTEFAKPSEQLEATRVPTSE